MAEEVNATSRTQIIVVEPSSGSVAVVNAGPQGPAGPSMEALLPLSPTDIGPGEPTPYAVYTDTGWQAPPTSNHVWSGSGWVMLSGALFGLERVVEEIFTTHVFAATDVPSVTLAGLGVDTDIDVSDTFTSNSFAATDGVTVALT